MSDNKPNLDLINMVQNARMQHDSDAKPSQVPAVYWIEAKNPAQTPTSRTGEWRIGTTVEFVDKLWEAIKTATEAGKLGYKSKVSTRPAHNQGHPDERIIAVRTYDADDPSDVARIQRFLLDEIGIPDDLMSYHKD